MESITKIATDYLIASEISFLPVAEKLPVTLSMCSKSNKLCTRDFNKSKYRLAYCHKESLLIWMKDANIISEVCLKTLEHYQIVRWIETMALESKIKQPFYYKYWSFETLLGQEGMYVVLDADLHEEEMEANSFDVVRMEIEKSTNYSFETHSA